MFLPGATALFLVGLAGTGGAQAPAHRDPPPLQRQLDPAGDPCRTVPAMPAAIREFQVRSLAARIENQPAPRAPQEAAVAFGAWQQQLFAKDYAGLCRYREANTHLPAQSEKRVVFFGDSITEAWSEVRPESFEPDWINRGIAGQTTKQMIGRFRADVIELHPDVVHILAGINDISGATGPTSLDQIASNLSTMVELARLHGIAVVLATLLPAKAYQGTADPERAAAIAALNAWIRQYSRCEQIALIDYYAALSDSNQSMPLFLTSDGIHPNARGYAVMEGLVRREFADSIEAGAELRPSSRSVADLCCHCGHPASE